MVKFIANGQYILIHKISIFAAPAWFGSVTSALNNSLKMSDRSNKKYIHCLFSCCLFFTILSISQLVALVLIGKHAYETATLSLPTKTLESQRNIERLSRNVQPKHYNITLFPNLDTGMYSGAVDINISILQTVECIKINSYKLSWKDVKMQSVDGRMV